MRQDMCSSALMMQHQTALSGPVVMNLTGSDKESTDSILHCFDPTPASFYGSRSLGVTHNETIIGANDNYVSFPKTQPFDFDTLGSDFWEASSTTDDFLSEIYQEIESPSTGIASEGLPGFTGPLSVSPMDSPPSRPIAQHETIPFATHEIVETSVMRDSIAPSFDINPFRPDSLDNTTASAAVIDAAAWTSTMIDNNHRRASLPHIADYEQQTSSTPSPQGIVPQWSRQSSVCASSANMGQHSSSLDETTWNNMMNSPINFETAQLDEPNPNMTIKRQSDGAYAFINYT